MKVLVFCENSDVVGSAFRAQGHDVTSSDLEPSAGSPNHYQGDGRWLLQKQWDLVIAHPPCTRLCNSGVRWLAERNLWDDMREGADFFLECLNANAARVAVENPIMHKYARAIVGRGPDCIVQPYDFGDWESKRTAFWTKNLPPLLPTIMRGEAIIAQSVFNAPPSADRWQLRSKTFPGMAAAMALQWGGLDTSDHNA